MRPGQIPYGVKDFKRIRLENRYYVDKTAYIRSDWSKLKTILDAQHAAVSFDRYAADPRVPKLAGGTPVHFIDLEFVGREMRVCEGVEFPIGGQSLACIETVD